MSLYGQIAILVVTAVDGRHRRVEVMIDVAMIAALMSDTWRIVHLVVTTLLASIVTSEAFHQCQPVFEIVETSPLRLHLLVREAVEATLFSHPVLRARLFSPHVLREHRIPTTVA